MLSVHFALNPLTLRESPSLFDPLPVKCRHARGRRTQLIIGLERWYIFVSLFIAFVVPIVPAALGHFGADPVYDAW